MVRKMILMNRNNTRILYITHTDKGFSVTKTVSYIDKLTLEQIQSRLVDPRDIYARSFFHELLY